MALTIADLKKIDRLILDHLKLQEERLDEKLVLKKDLYEAKRLLEQKMDLLYATKEELKEAKEELLENISHLPTKSEFYEWMDKIMGELKAVREEQTMITQHVADCRDEVLELKTLITTKI